MNAQKAACLALLTSLAACNSGERDDSAYMSFGTGGNGATGGAPSGETGGNSSSGGAGGSGGGVATGGGTGVAGAGPTSCGDGQRYDDEACDGSALAGEDCRAFGFDSGTLACDETCDFDVSGCEGIEQCFDGKDNDGDGLVDCLDTDDCAAVCASSCSEVPTLSDPASVKGATWGGPSDLASSCGAIGSTASEIVYEIQAAMTGTLEAELDTSRLLNVSLRTTCGDDDSEVACGRRRASMPVVLGQTVYVVVDGFESVDGGLFGLDVYSRPNDVCGDGFLDQGEECDDENFEPGDGCDATCTLESSETEPNDSPATANPWGAPFYAQIAPEDDVDVVSIEVASSGATLTAAANNLGIGLCSSGEMDTFLEVIGPDQTTVVASDDDSGEGYCARVVATGLEAGTYYVRTRAIAGSGRPTFPYRLDVLVE